MTLAPFDEVAGALTVSMQTTFMIFLVGILFIWYLSSRLIRGIIRQFDALIQKMKLFTQNELELEPEEAFLSRQNIYDHHKKRSYR